MRPKMRPLPRSARCPVPKSASPPPRGPTISKPSGCRSRRTARSRRRRGCCRVPRTCTTPPSTGARCSTAPRACGAAMPAITAPDRRGDPGQAAELDYAPAFQFGHPKAFELACRMAALARAISTTSSSPIPVPRRSNRAQDRARLSPRPRRGHAHPADRPRARLSRRRFRRHFGRRHRQQPQVLRRAAGRRRSPAAIPIAASIRPSPAASPNGARISPTISNASSRCTTPPPSRRSSSSRWRARPAC